MGVIIPSTIKQDISLADKNWFGTGGNARFFASPTNAQEFQQAVCFALSYQFPVYLLGKGANVLIADEGFNGLIIQPQLREIKIEKKDHHNVLVKAGAGVSLDHLISWCLDHQLIGLEEFSGIPGTVGGAVYINLHYFEFLLQQFLVSATVIDAHTGVMEQVDNKWFEFGYDYSRLHKKNHYLVDATFNVQVVSSEQAAFAKGRSVEIIRHRARRYPQKNTCGSFFRNFHENEVTLLIDGKKMIYVAYYLDKLGIKGSLRFGGALVSPQHANMIVNTGNATTADIVMVALTMQSQVFKEFGVSPIPECQLIGFQDDVLL